MAFNTPFKLYKIHASWEGGTADPLVMSWPAGLDTRGTLCEKYLHATDLVPTLYDLMGITAPETIRYVPQTPLEGVSMAAVLRDSSAPSPKHTQFYSMMGTRAIWRDGWQANTAHAPGPAGWGHFDHDRWRLYHLDDDRNQMIDRADDEPELLAELIEQWHQQATRYHGYPLDDRSQMDLGAVERPSVADTSGRIKLFPGGSEIPERSFVMIGRSFAISAALTINDPACEGVIFASGGRFGGHSLYLTAGQLHYVYNWLGEREQHLTGTQLPVGRVVVGVKFTKQGADGPSPTGTAHLYTGSDIVATADLTIQPLYFSLGGEGANIGRDRGQPVTTAYKSPFPLTGATVAHVTIDVGDDISVDLQRETQAAFRRE
jgi:arylsulfatase